MIDVADRYPGAASLQEYGVVVDVEFSAMQADGSFSEPMTVKFLVDTGATMSAIRPTIAQQTTPFAHTDRFVAFGIDGKVDVQTFTGILAFGEGDGARKSAKQMAIQTLPNGANDYDGILGRDFLRMLVMTYDGPAGHFTIGCP
jgi:hypothetical protein